MRGITFLGDRELEIRDFPDPKPGPGEVILQMKASGMCGSDLHAYRASRKGGGMAASLGLGGDGGPVIAGHEPCGVVAERGAGVTEAEAPIGQRVMQHHYKGCGLCKHCRTGWSQLCGKGITVYGVTGHGGHAPYMKVPRLHAGAAARRAVVRGRRGGVLRHRHRLRRAPPHRHLRASTPSPSSARARWACPPPCWARPWARA